MCTATLLKLEKHRNNRPKFPCDTGTIILLVLTINAFHKALVFRFIDC